MFDVVHKIFSFVLQTLADWEGVAEDINGSCAYLIINNEVGYMCVSGDSEALANIIKGLDIKELQEISKKAKEVYFKKYSKLFIK